MNQIAGKDTGGLVMKTWLIVFFFQPSIPWRVGHIRKSKEFIQFHFCGGSLLVEKKPTVVASFF